MEAQLLVLLWKQQCHPKCELNQRFLHNPSLPGEKELKRPDAQLQLSSCWWHCGHASSDGSMNRVPTERTLSQTPMGWAGHHGAIFAVQNTSSCCRTTGGTSHLNHHEDTEKENHQKTMRSGGFTYWAISIIPHGVTMSPSWRAGLTSGQLPGTRNNHFPPACPWLPS